MSTKLTLTVDKNVIDRAKKYAKARGRSLSEIIENLLIGITSEEVEDEQEISPIVKSLRGSFKAPSDMDYKEELTEILSKKYLDS